MRLDEILDRCANLEARAAALYRAYATSSADSSAAHDLWASMADDEGDHVRSIAVARDNLEATKRWRTRVDGWSDALAEVEERLTAAERLGGSGTTARRLSAALDLELSELDALRLGVLAACGQTADASAGHAAHLAEMATQLSDDPHVRLQAALLRAQARLDR